MEKDHQSSESHNEFIPNIKMAEILNALGQHIHEIIGRHPNGSFLYAEKDGGTYEVGLYVEKESEVIAYEPDGELFDEIINLWDAAYDQEKWAILQYGVHDDKFGASFIYPDGIDQEESSFDRSERILKSRFDDKPIIYPPPAAGMVELTLADLAHLNDDHD